MVAEDEGRGDGEGDVHHLATGVHVLHHAEGSDGVGKARQQACGGGVVDAQKPAQLQQGLAQEPGQQVDQWEGTGQHDGDLAHRQEAVLDGGHAGDDHEACQGLHDGGGKTCGDHRHHGFPEEPEAPDHPFFRFPKAQRDQHRDQHDGDQVPQDHQHREACREPAHQNAHGDGDDAAQDPLRHGRAILLRQNAHGHRQSEHDGGTQHGAGEDATQQSGLRVLGQLRRQRTAAHVTGQDGPGEHGRVCPQGPVHRYHQRPEQGRQHRGQRDDADHGDRQRPHGEDALLKMTPDPQTPSGDPVHRTGKGGQRHDGDHDLMCGHGVPP